MSEEPKTDAAPSASPAGGNKLVMILTIVNVVATLAIIGLLVVSFQKEKTPPKIEDIAVEKKDDSHGEKKEGDAHGEKKDAEHGGEHGDAKPDAHAAANPSGHQTSQQFGKMIALDQFVVNLSTPGSSVPKYIRVKVSLEVGNAEAEAEVTAKMPQVRNVIIDLFNSKRPADLSTPEGRDFLKEEIRNAINGFMTTGKVKGVYFTNFAVTT